MATLFVDKLDPQSGTTLEIGTSGDTINVPSGATLDINSGATITNNGTANSFGGTTAPYLAVKNSGDIALADNVWTVLSMTSETVDSGSAYDTTTYKFTPQTSGYYYVSVNVTFGNTIAYNINKTNTAIYKNGSSADFAQPDMVGAAQWNEQLNISGIVQCNGSTDYIQGYAKIDVGSGSPYALLAYMNIFKMTE